MRNPSHPFSSESDVVRDATQELVALTALPLRWTGKGARVIAHSLAAALDGALHPALVYVGLTDPASDQTATALVGQACSDAGVSAAQWREFLTPWLTVSAEEAVRTIPHPSRSGKLRLVVQPVGVDGKNGVVALASSDAAFPQERDLLLLQVAANQAAVGLAHLHTSKTIEPRNSDEESAHMLAAEREFRHEAELLRDLGIALNSELDLQALLQRVTDAATAAIGAEFGAFFYNLVDARGESYTLYTLSGAPREAFAKFPLPRNTEVFGPTFRGEGTVRSADIRQDPRYGKNAPYRGMPSGHLPVVSYLAVPVRSRSGEVFGGLFFGHAMADRFSERHERIVEGIAGQAATAIDNVRLFNATRDHAERLRITHARAPMGIGEADLEGRLQVVNDRYGEILGYTREELIGRKFTDFVHPDDADADREKFQALIAGDGDAYDREKRYIRKDGRVIWGRISVAIIRDANGAPRYVVGILEDITARHAAEERARFLAEASKNLTRSLDYKNTLVSVAHLAVPVLADWCATYLTVADGKLERIAAAHADTTTLAAFEELREYRPPQGGDCGPFKVVRTRQTHFIADTATATADTGSAESGYLETLRRLNVASYLCVPLVARTRVLGAFTVFNVTSARRLDEADREFVEELASRAAMAIDNALLFDAVREQAARLQATYEGAPIGIAEIALDGKFFGVNDRFCAIVGYTREELLAQRYQRVADSADDAGEADLMRDLRDGKISSYTIEKRYLHKNGNAVWIHLTASLVRDMQGRPEYSIAAIEDITERRRAEIVIKGQRRALEQMARGEPLPIVLETLVETFDRQSVSGGIGMVLLVDTESGVLRPAATGQLPEGWIEKLRALPIGPNAASCGAAAHTGQSVFTTDIVTDPIWESFRDEALAFGFRAAGSLCLRSSVGKVLGTFDMFYREAGARKDDELRFVELIVDTAAIAVERHQHEQSLKLQAQVLSQIHDAVVVMDLQGRVLRWNEGAERMFGYSTAEAIGQHLSSLCLSPAEYPWLQQHVIRPLQRQGRLERVAQLRRRSGDFLHAHMALSLLTDNHGAPSAMVGYLLDVTERVDAEKELGVRVRQQAAVTRLGQTALSGVSLQALLDEAAQVVTQTLELDCADVLECQADGQTLLMRAGVGWSDGLVGRHCVSAAVDSQPGYTLVAPEPVIVADLKSDARFNKTMRLDIGIVSSMSVVIAGEPDRPYGVLAAHSKVARRFSENDVNFLQAMAHILATAIQRKRFEEAMRVAHEDLERRVDERTAELGRINQSLRDEVVERMGVETALRDSESQYRMLFERNPLSAWVFDINSRNILAANETAVWQYGYTREEFLRMSVNDLHPAEESGRSLEYAGQFPPETAYVGVWKHRKQDETIIDVEVFVYEVLFQGRWARLMLASDITERRRTEHELRLIETITRAVNEAHDVDAALYAVLRPICEATGWILGEAWLPTPDGQRMHASRAWYCSVEGLDAFRAATWEREFSGGEGLIGRAWTTRQPVWMADVTSDEAFLRAAEARAAGLRAGIAFPVFGENDTVALLAFFLREPRLQDEHQIKLVSTISAQVGIAIQRKRAEEKLRESEERFRLLVEGAHDYAIFLLDSEGRIATWNKGAERLNGYTEDEIIGCSVDRFYIPEDINRRSPQRALAQAAAVGVYESEGWRVRKNGERFWASVTLTALREANNALRGFVKVTRDISERKQAEERLKQIETRLARAQEFSLLMIAHVGLDGQWLKVPPMLCATLAYREEELLAGRFQNVTHPDDVAAEWEQCERLRRGEAKSFDLEKRFLRRDGKIIWVYQNTSIVLDVDDKPLHFITFIRDITQRKEAEEQLRRSEIQLNEAQRLAHLGSWEWDIESGNMEWSDELYRIYGVPARSRMTYEAFLNGLHVEDRERVRTAISEAIQAQQPFTLEQRIVRHDGEVRYLLSNGAIVANRRGEAARMVGVCLDITERKRAEERLRDYANRLQTLSQRLLEAQETERRRIARELHDQIGQDLSVIKINLLALQRLPGTATVAPQVEETIRIVEDVLQTARNLSVELRPSMLDDLGLPAALRWYLDRQAQRAGITLHFAVDVIEARMKPMIETACFRLAQEALTNILRHASAHHVEVTLSQNEHELELRIVDDGEGFDVDAARERAARGESFGLLGMEERALLAGGELEIISTHGQGTTVTARFPLPLTSGTINERH